MGLETNMTRNSAYHLQCAKALNLKLAGHTYQEIATKEGYSIKTARRRVVHAIEQLTDKHTT